LSRHATTQASTTAATPAAGSAAGARLLQRKCACGESAKLTGECEDCAKKRLTVQRRAMGGSTPPAPPLVHEVLSAPGRPLDSAARAFMEMRLRHDFSRVRVHTDAPAARSADMMGAVAYTVGSDLAFASGHFAPHTEPGRRLLAHELTHVIQQGDPGRQPAALSDITVGSPDSAAEREADRFAAAAMDSRPAPSLSRARPALMRLTLTEFRTKLGSTADQKKAIDTLFAEAQFKALNDYLAACPSTPKKDLGPLSLKVTPGLKIGGVERFGGYSPMDRKLEINPTKAEHVANPQELVDTVVHEMIHAVDDLDDQCVTDGAPASPLKGAGTSGGPKLADVKGTADEDKLLTELGPGASNPCEEFLDINKQAQQMIVSIIRSNIKATGVGKPTLVFLNDLIGREPKALADYKVCRDAACAKPQKADRDAAIAKCGEDIIAKYGKAASKPAPVPAPAPGVFPPSPPPPRAPPKQQP
jgi:hypothetical protein